VNSLADDGQAVVAAFERWASLQRRAPRHVAALVSGIEESSEAIGLLATEIRGRRLVWRSVPAGGRARVTVPAVTIESLDAWSVDQAALRLKSDHIAICPTCGGAKKVDCHECGGAGKTVCTACGGRRKMYGYASNGSYRLLNCAACRGRGDIDCGNCRRGLATCSRCQGEGRVQQWIELETWTRSVSAAHPLTLARQLRWDDDPSEKDVARDAEVTADIARPHRLTSADIGDIPPRWLDVLMTDFQAGERVTRQRFRIARVPTHTVTYRLGGDDDRVAFRGRRLVPPSANTPTALNGRGSRLRSLSWLLIIIGIVAAIVSLGRGAFFWSVLTFLSLAAAAGGLAAIYGAVAEWTAARRWTHRWLVVATAFIAIAVALAAGALPRIDHAEGLIAAEKLDEAASELTALGDAPVVWADLRLARIRQTKDVNAARNELAMISANLPQHAAAVTAADRLILATANRDVASEQESRAAETLALLSEGARGKPESIATAKSVYLPLATQQIARREWSSAAASVIAARRLGVAAADLNPLITALAAAGAKSAAEADRAMDPKRRLRLRLAAEQILVASETASESSNTRELIVLRTAMARDIAAMEKTARRRSR
jgi:hypothetical protein